MPVEQLIKASETHLFNRRRKEFWLVVVMICLTLVSVTCALSLNSALRTVNDLRGASLSTALANSPYLARVSDPTENERRFKEREKILLEAKARFRSDDAIDPSYVNAALARLYIDKAREADGFSHFKEELKYLKLAKQYASPEFQPYIEKEMLLAESEEFNRPEGYETQRSLLLQALNLAKEISPKDESDVLAYLSDNARSRNEYAEAIDHQKKSVDLDKNSSAKWSDLAIYQKLNGNLKGALRSLDEAIRLQPESVSYKLVHACYLYLDGRTKEAWDEFNKVLPKAQWRELRDFRHIVLFYAIARETNEFYDALERALKRAGDEGDTWTSTWLDQETELNFYREEKRFKDLVAAYRTKLEQNAR